MTKGKKTVKENAGEKGETTLAHRTQHVFSCYNEQVSGEEPLDLNEEGNIKGHKVDAAGGLKGIMAQGQGAGLLYSSLAEPAT